MSPTHSTHKTARNWARLTLAAAVLVTIGRVLQLAVSADAGLPGDAVATKSVSSQTLVNTDSSASTSAGWLGSSDSEPPVSEPPVAATSKQQADAELADLYKACPLASVIDLTTVAESPEKVDAILPPYRETANRVPNPPLEPAIPRIRYPVHARSSHARTAQPTDELRIAAKPASPSSTAATSGGGDWLIDPEDWFTPDAKPSTEPSQPVSEPATPESTPAPSTPAAPAPSEGHPADPHRAESKSTPLADPPVAAPADLELPPVGFPAETATPPVEPGAPPADPAMPELPPEATTTPASSSPPPVPADDIAPPAANEPLFSPPAAAGALPIAPATEPPQAPGQLPVPAGAATTAPTPPFAPPPNPVAPATPGAAGAAADPAPPKGPPPNVDPHLELYTKSAYPSARECAVCHEEIYEQWSVSAHAYAAISPMFNKFEQKLNDLSQGTVGYFCMRCHAPVATALCESRDMPIWKMPEAAREGITCVACHRVQYAYGKSNGERHIDTGDINAPVFGGIGGDGVAEAIAKKDEFKVKTDPNEKGPGQNIHISGIYFQPLTRSEFCTPCHQVAVQPGIKLEVVWEQYRASPACKKGIQCQDCHMGRVPGVAAGYECGAIAKVNGKTVNDNRKKSNHIFYGPNYPIAHPGIFPFHLKANRWTVDQWLTFDWRAGWGTKKFEDDIADKKIECTFPPLWAEADDRLDAREIIDANFKKIEKKKELRIQVMENGSHVEGPIFDSPLCRGKDLDLHFIVTNTNDGHNLLTASLGAQPQLWANIVLIGPDGRRLWETGYTDSWGDVANIHSHDVRDKNLAFDWQLFNLQTMFLITGAKGTDREFFIPVNIDIDQLPFIRPGTQPITTLNHPPFIRMESQSLAALGSRRVPYRIPGELIRQSGKYRLSFRMRSRSEPIYFMQFCGATEEMVRSMNEWMIDVHPMSVEFIVP